jgi:Mechanosensitive ion channel, conserved TM helix
MTETWGDLVWAALNDLLFRLIAILPAVLAMLTLIAVGSVLAWGARALLLRLARAVRLDTRSETWGLAAALRRGGVRRPVSQVLGLLVFWGIFALFATLAIDTLAGAGTGRITERVFGWVSTALGAGLILLVGWVAANFLRQSVLIAAVNAGVPEARYLARAAHWGVLLFAAAMAVTHLGIAKEMVLVAFGITFGGLILSLALAFGLGGRGLAREILQRRLRHEPHPRETLTHL